MKNLHTVIKSSLLFAIIVSADAFSADVVAITRVKGPSFGVTSGATKMLTTKTNLADKSEIMTEESGQVSFRDFFDHTYHMAPGTQLVLNKAGIELKSGLLWVQAHPRAETFSIRTINGVVEFQGGEFIVSFNEETGKTQLMSISGQIDFYNALEAQLRLTVDSGQFSLIDQKYQQGMPRVPTPIGFDSFKKTTALFEGIAPMSNEEFKAISSRDSAAPKKEAKQLDLLKREIASVDEEKFPSVEIEKQPKIEAPIPDQVAAPKASAPESIPSAAAYLDIIEKPKTKKHHSPSGLSVPKVTIYRFNGIKFSPIPVVTDKAATPVQAPAPVVPVASKPVKVEAGPDAPVVKVAPAPVQEAQPQVQAVVPERTPSSVTPDDNSFDQSLKKAYQESPKHEGEVQDLIKELKNYKKDFQSTY